MFNNDDKYQWDEQCQKSLDVHKQNMVSTLILVFPDWRKEFHAHVSASSIALGVVITQPGKGYIDHPIAFSSRILSAIETNYTTREWEGPARVYALQKF